MKRGLALKLALCAAMAAGAAVNAFAQDAGAQSAPAVTKKASHGNWDVICVAPRGASQVCHAVQVLELVSAPQGQGAQAPQPGQRLLRLVAQKGADGTVFNFELPFGLDLRPGIVYQVDAEPEVNLPFLTCMPSGCVASILLKDEARKRIAGGKQLKVGFRPLGSEKVVVVEVDLKGLDKALDAL